MFVLSQECLHEQPFTAICTVCVLGEELYAAWGRGVNAFNFLKMESNQSGPCGKKPKYPGQVVLLYCRVLSNFIYVVRHAKQGSAGMVTFTSAGCGCSNSTCAGFANPSGYLLLKLSKLCSFSLPRVMILPERGM